MSQYQQPPQTQQGSTGTREQTGGQGGGVGHQAMPGGESSAVQGQQAAGGTWQQSQVQGARQTGQRSAQGGRPQGAQPMEFPTRSYLPENVRRPVVQQLNRALADTTVLMTHANFAHWNVKGMSFWGLHELFEELAETFAEHADLVAERITALGGQALGTAGMAVSRCRIPQMPSDVVTGDEYVDVLAERLAVHDANLYQDITTANQYDDLDTADLLNEVSRDVSKALWFLEAHRQTQPVSVGGGQAQQEAPGQSIPQSGQSLQNAQQSRGASDQQMSQPQPGQPHQPGQPTQ